MLFGMGMGRFDAGGPPTLLERVLAVINSILQFPLVTLVLALPHSFGMWLHGPVQHLPFVLNSFLWAACIYYVLVRVLRKTQRK